MSQPHKRLLIGWILTFLCMAAILVVLGGYVRLTRSGLSIVEWNPIYGVLPPLNQHSWEQEFAKYKLSPEFIKINYGMTLDQFKEIYFLEWVHRLIARLAGLVFAIPFFFFLCNRTISFKQSRPYLLMGCLFLVQAVMGWIMVSSGLVERPAVSHFALAAHLLFAFLLIGLALWQTLNLLFGQLQPKTNWSLSSSLFASVLTILMIEILYGAFTAGLKAGHVSNTWPLMYGQIIPQGLLSQIESPLLNFLESPLTVMFVHRWLAFLVLIVASVFYWINRKQVFRPELRLSLRFLLAITILQIFLGVMVVLHNVDIALALIHQANAIVLFMVAVFALHRLRAVDV